MRIDFRILEHWIAPGSRVLDLGCGDGSLLDHLQQTKQARGYGLEINADHIERCVAKGVNVIEQNLDAGLSNIASHSFDTVIMSQVLQTMRYPDRVISDMLRVGREAIVTFPNFGHWRARWHLSLKGRMPVSDLLPYEWYNTPNIHFCTFADFEHLCQERGWRVLDRQVAAETSPGHWLHPIWPNLFGETALYRLCA